MDFEMVRYLSKWYDIFLVSSRMTTKRGNTIDIVRLNLRNKWRFKDCVSFFRVHNLA